MAVCFCKSSLLLKTSGHNAHLTKSISDELAMLLADNPGSKFAEEATDPRPLWPLKLSADDSTEPLSSLSRPDPEMPGCIRSKSSSTTMAWTSLGFKL